VPAATLVLPTGIGAVVRSVKEYARICTNVVQAPLIVQGALVTSAVPLLMADGPVGALVPYLAAVVPKHVLAIILLLRAAAPTVLDQAHKLVTPPVAVTVPVVQLIANAAAIIVQATFVKPASKTVQLPGRMPALIPY